MANLTILRKLAQTKPESLPASVLLTHSPTSLTIFDAYPKSIFHFLILPRPLPPCSVSDLISLRTLLKSDKARAKEVLFRLREDANTVKKMVQDEMMSRYGFKWDIWVGFHAVPSLEYLHLHVISNDLCSPALKSKKHNNSFHPKIGFFLHLDDVLEWFEAEPSFYEAISDLKRSQYDTLLKEDLWCWRCGQAMKNVPTLKAHLQAEWEKERMAKVKPKKSVNQPEGGDEDTTSDVKSPG